MYMGYKEINLNGATGEVTITDTREIGPEVFNRVERASAYYSNLILETVPEYKQRNIGMGIIPKDKANELISQINTLRAQHDADVLVISNCTTLEEFDKLQLPY